MVQLAFECDSCKGTGENPPFDPVHAPCLNCSGSGYVLTDEGKQLRMFVLALLGDGDVEVYAKVLKFVQFIKLEINRPGASRRA